MKWFKKKPKNPDHKQDQTRALPQHNGTPPAFRPAATGVSVFLLEKLPAPLVEKIFNFVCPHTLDETYESCELSATAVGDTCMLCDLRDLSHCAQTCKRWRNLAPNVLYHSIRIDPVHYCQLEGDLAEKRKRRSHFNRNAEPEDVPQTRLRLLQRTLHERRDYALKVIYLKVPYMTRETTKPDLARTISLLPNLRFVDLPEGVYKDEADCNTLKQEIQARCPDLRKMSYMSGGERSLELLATGRLWQNLEVLELSKLSMDPTILRRAVGSLPQLRALKISDMKDLHDQIFQESDQLPHFPAVVELILENTPNITAEGLLAFLFFEETQNALKTLSLTATGVLPSTLQYILDVTPVLEQLSIVEDVSTSFPTGNQIKPLSSKSLKVFHYEISSDSSANKYANTTTSYYDYLRTSLSLNGLSNLRALYVRDADFPESLLDLAPPVPAFASDPDNFPRPRSQGLRASNGFQSPTQNRFSSNNPFAKMATGPAPTHELVVYSKGLDEMEWNFSRVQPMQQGRRGSATTPRPVSSYGLGDNMGRWNAGGSRQSVIVGNGFGGFLAVPKDDGARPTSSTGEKGSRGSQYDMWR